MIQYLTNKPLSGAKSMLSEVEVCLWTQHKLRHNSHPSTSLRMLTFLGNLFIQKVLTYDL